MDYASLLRDVEHGQVPAVALLHGPEALLLDDALALVSRALFPDASAAALGREILDSRTTSSDAIVRAALTLPFLGGTRLVAVKHAQALPARQNDALVAYFKAPSQSTCLLFLADESLHAHRERREHWLLGAVPSGTAVEVGPRKGRELERWLQQRARRDGLEVDDEAARLLPQLVGDDLAALLAEAHKAALAGGPDNRRVGVAEVRAVVGAHRLSGIFELTNAIERGQVGAALAVLTALLAAGEEPMRLLGLLTNDVRTTWSIKQADGQGQSAEQIARVLRRPRPVVDTLVTRAAAISVPELARRLRQCWMVEQRLKSGGRPQAELTALIASLC